MNGESEAILDIGELVECKRENKNLNVIDNRWLLFFSDW